ncbi:MAG: M28 family peptidase [Sphingomicrobium sp.]
MTRIELFAASALALVAVSIAGQAAAQNASAFDPARLSRHVQTLGSDAYEGRGPATRAETKTVAYLIEQFKAAGLQPGGAIVNGKRQWTQPVPLLKSEIVGTPQLRLNLGTTTENLVQGEQIAVRSPLTGVSAVNLTNAPLLFVGYGVSAPERQWDDFKDADVRGKILVMLVNDPDFEGTAGDPMRGDFGGKAMTYYGRWTYKYAEAARRGAAGVMLIHETGPASYGWATVKNSNTNTMFDIVRANPASEHTPFDSWIQRDLAVKLFQASGLDFEAARAAARRKDFRPMPLKATLSATVTAKTETINSSNVVGLLRGKRHPDETLIYSGHWDHLGIGKPDANGDNIYNGAIDNGTGIAQLIEQARAFAHEPRTDRSVVFLAVSVEEKGLLGSEYYAGNPLYPLGKTVGVLNTDSMGVWGPARNFSISGTAKLGLLDELIEEGAHQGRTFQPDPHPESGGFFRSDHFSFAKVGVPAISFKSGNDLVTGGIARGEAVSADYTAKRYHQPDDEWSPDWDFTGIAQDAALLHSLGLRLANSREWPNWSDDSEFRSVRDKSAADRGVAAPPPPAKRGERA